MIYKSACAIYLFLAICANQSTYSQGWVPYLVPLSISAPRHYSIVPTYQITRARPMLDFSKSPSVPPVDPNALSIVSASTVSTTSNATNTATSAPQPTEVSNHHPKRWFPSKFFRFGSPNDGLTFRQRLAKAGLSVALSYGWVSNYSYACTMSLAWYLFSKRTGLSPLAPGQWKPFLAVYAAFYVFNNLVRPIRFALALSLSTYLDRMVQAIQNRWTCRRGVAMTLVILIGNVVGTFVLMGLGISAASVAAGVPIWAGAAKSITP